MCEGFVGFYRLDMAFLGGIETCEGLGRKGLGLEIETV
jgi:hypothetical protein